MLPSPAHTQEHWTFNRNTCTLVELSTTQLMYLTSDVAEFRACISPCSSYLTFVPGTAFISGVLFKYEEDAIAFKLRFQL